MIQCLQGAPKVLKEVVSGLALPHCCGIEEVAGIELGEGRLVRTVILVVIIPGHQAEEIVHTTLLSYNDKRGGETRGVWMTQW